MKLIKLLLTAVLGTIQIVIGLIIIPLWLSTWYIDAIIGAINGDEFTLDKIAKV